MLCDINRDANLSFFSGCAKMRGCDNIRMEHKRMGRVNWLAFPDIERCRSDLPTCKGIEESVLLNNPAAGDIYNTDTIPHFAKGFRPNHPGCFLELWNVYGYEISLGIKSIEVKQANSKCGSLLR